MEEKQSTLVTLQPFVHQVGGHSSIQQLDKNTVCKPLFSKELRFYEEVCSAFKPFIPEFKGVATVKDVKVSEGHKHQILSSSDDIKLHTYRYGKHCTTCSCKQYNTSINTNKLGEDGECESSSSDDESDSSSLTNGSDMDNSSLECILLENVVGSFKYPSILDLKMGTEKHKDYIISNKEEADRRQARWDQTTSKSLGVRVCGMKVYLINKDSFFLMTVSECRDLTIQGFKDAIKTFLFNGGRFRHEVIEPYLGQLRELLNVMETQPSYRFYNTSLLLIYEGEDNSIAHVGHTSHDDVHMFHSNARNLVETNVGVRMIDFAHAHYKQHSIGDLKVPDEGYLFGLRSLIRILEEILIGFSTKVK